MGLRLTRAAMPRAASLYVKQHPRGRFSSVGVIFVYGVILVRCIYVRQVHKCRRIFKESMIANNGECHAYSYSC